MSNSPISTPPAVDFKIVEASILANKIVSESPLPFEEWVSVVICHKLGWDNVPRLELGEFLNAVDAMTREV